MSKSASGGSAKNVKDSPGQRLGVKVFGGQKVSVGDIIVRQRGLTKMAGTGTKLARDYTIFATKDGTVSYKPTSKTLFSGRRVRRTLVEVKQK